MGYSSALVVGDLERDIALFLLSGTGAFTMDDLLQWLRRRYWEELPSVEPLCTALNNVFHKGGFKLELQADYTIRFFPTL